jgi:hypothetical protein
MSTHRPHRIDRDTAEHLLAGAPAARRRVGPLGEYLAAAAAPGTPHELAGGSAALAAFQAAHLQPADKQRRTSMLKTALAKLLTVKAAALLAVTAAGGVALAATTGALPNPLTNTPAATPSATHATGRPTATPSPRSGGPSAMPSASLLGLCHAYTAGAGTDNGKALTDPAFTDLITAAGGASKVTTFCATILASAAANAASHPGAPADTTHPTDRPTSTPASSQHPTVAPTEHPTGPPPSHPGH